MLFFLTLNFEYMAVIQLGMIITNIAGSIGGTTFRRGNTYLSVMNKNRGSSKTARRSQNRLAQIGNIFSMYETLDSTQLAGWLALASAELFPDKFGVLRNITPRQIFNKCNVNLLCVPTIVLDPLLLSKSISTFDIDSFNPDYSGGNLTAVIASVNRNNYFIFQAEYDFNKLHKASFIRREIIACVQSSTGFSLDLYPEIFNKFPYMQVGGKLRLYVTPMSLRGIRGATKFIDAIVT